MGLCASSDNSDPEERNRSRALDKLASSERDKDALITKLLLLGAGESGKSTLFKQMVTIYGTGFPEHERKNYAPIIFNNIITSMQALVNEAPTHGGPIECTESAQYLKDMDVEAAIDSSNVNHLTSLWADSGIQKAYENRAKFQVFDSAQYFFTKLADVSAADYIPSEQDVLRSRVKTTGIVENHFKIDGSEFHMFDVGGQRNERKKWIHCFENVTALLFVGVLSEYDLVLYEDETVNRMEETLTLFDETANSEWFEQTSIILFLNKCDVFETKITKVPLTVCPVFEDYTGPNTYKDGCELIEKAFLAKVRNPEKVIYPHVTCATDTKNVQVVFAAVKDIVVRKSVEDSGLV